MPPYSEKAELGVLGCMMLAPAECVPQVQVKFKAGGEEFYDLKNRVIYEAILAEFDAKKFVDVITLWERLKANQQLEGAGGLDYVAALPDKAPSAGNLMYYVDIVHDKFLLREGIRTATQFIGTVYQKQHETPARQLMDQFEADVMRVNEAHLTPETPVIKNVVLEVIDQIETNHRRGVGLITGIGTGFSFFDKMTGGLQKGEFIIVAGRPGSGKSSLVMNIAERVSVDAKIPTFVVSAEMKATALTLRMICTRSRVNARSFKTGFMSERDLTKFSSVAGAIANAPLVIDDGRMPAVETVRAKLRRWTHERRKMWEAQGGKPEDFKALAVIDYAQRLTTTNRDAIRAGDREKFNHISQELANTAVELDIPVVVAAQINRDSVKKQGKRRLPTQDDLAEADGFTRDADTIALLHYDELDEDAEIIARRDACWPVTLVVDKQRNGETGPVELMFFKQFTRFEDRHRPTQEQEEMNRGGAEARSGENDPDYILPRSERGEENPE